MKFILGFLASLFAFLPSVACAFEIPTRASAIATVRTNTSDFCRRNMMLRFLNANGRSPERAYSRPLSEIEALVDVSINGDISWSTNRPNYETFDVWNLAMLSTERSRRLSTRFQEYGTPNYYPDDFFRTMTPITSDQSEPQRILEIISRNPYRVNPEDSARKTGWCTLNRLTDIGGCIRAINIIEETMMPSHSMEFAISNHQGWIEVYDHDDYDDGLRLAARRIEGKLREQNPRPTDNIFDDLNSAFIDSGLNATNAYNATWNVLGTIATAGPNMAAYVHMIEGYHAQRGEFRKTSQKGLALGFIAQAMTGLDAIKARQGHSLYSYPSTVQTTCDNAKPYHFWLAAFLSRKLKNGYQIGSHTAALATYFAEQMYQVMRHVGLRSESRNSVSGVLSRRITDPVLQIVRTDLAYAATGAWYGVLSPQERLSKSLNANRVLQVLMENSQDFTPLERSAAAELNLLDKYLRFTDVFEPQSAFNEAQRFAN